LPIAAATRPASSRNDHRLKGGRFDGRLKARLVGVQESKDSALDACPRGSFNAG
jgi:hypothetical protein